MMLDLGEVNVAATVWMNESKVGDRLWPPYRFDISHVVRRGTNIIKIQVGNLLNNCYGDNRVSGLLGPVRLLIP